MAQTDRVALNSGSVALTERKSYFLIATASFVFLLKAVGVERIISNVVSTDFRSFYLAGQAFLKGGNPYDVDFLRSLATTADVAGSIFPYLYPPPLAIYLSPLAKMRALEASWLWLLSSIVLSAFVMLQGMRLVIHLQKQRNLEIQSWPQAALFLFLALLLLLLLPFDNNLRLGQVNILVLVFIVASLTQSLENGRDFLAGVLLAPAVLIKQTPAILLLFFLMERRHRAIFGFFVGVLLFAGPTLLLNDGIAVWRHYFDFTGSLSYGKTIAGLFPLASLMNFSVAGGVARLVSDETLITALTWSILAAMGLLLILRHRILASTGESAALLLSYLTFMVVASPLVYLHHVVYLYPGLLFSAWLFLAGESRRSYPLFALLLCLIVLSGTDFPLLYDRFGINHILLRSLNLYALLGIFTLGVLSRREWDDRRGSNK